ncbi:MAG TPA: hypothetical protein VFM90_12065, partial [Cyclobacteriaceae bacterium]|nr:hypothetical protein [Cyclobacteriaceae bacterium]
AFVFPIIMTLFFIPFIYCYAVYMKYDELFSLTNHWAKDKTKARNIKRQILWTAKLNLWVLWIIRFNLYKVDFTRDNLDGAIKVMVNENQLPTKAIRHGGTLDD